METNFFVFFDAESGEKFGEAEEPAAGAGLRRRRF
jgi:hypothetical protein